MRIEDQAPIVGSALVGGMAQSWLIDRYPQWSWLLSLGLVGGGMYLGTRHGWQEKVGLGIGSAGATGLGVGLLQIGGTTGGVTKQLGAGTPAGLLPVGRVGRYPAPVYKEEFQPVRLA